MISLVNFQKNVNFQNSPPWTLRLQKKNVRMQLKTIILSKVSQKEKDRYHITYIWNLKYDTNEPIYKTETDS